VVYGDLRHDALHEIGADIMGADAIVHLAEMPSAPYSMMSLGNCALTVENNVIGTLRLLWAMKEACPEAHLVKLGSMGEYGTPNTDIPEGTVEMEFRGRRDEFLFPRRPGSFYHASKVADTYNVELACRCWGLRATDVMQGVVYGVSHEHMEPGEQGLTRFDCDAVFGTSINRFCAQAVAGLPITPYGSGGQVRGFLPLRDSLQCLALAIENPPGPGEYRTFNQLENTYSIREIANLVAAAAIRAGLEPNVVHLENPRLEEEEHYYKPDAKHLLELGYVPTWNMPAELDDLLSILIRYRERIEARSTLPDVQWSGERRLADYRRGT